MPPTTAVELSLRPTSWAMIGYFIGHVEGSSGWNTITLLHLFEGYGTDLRLARAPVLPVVEMRLRVERKVLDRNIDLGATADMAGEPGMAFQRLPQRIQTGERNLDRTSGLRSRDDFIN